MDNETGGEGGGEDGCIIFDGEEAEAGSMLRVDHHPKGNVWDFFLFLICWTDGFDAEMLFLFLKSLMSKMGSYILSSGLLFSMPDVLPARPLVHDFHHPLCPR